MPEDYLTAIRAIRMLAGRLEQVEHAAERVAAGAGGAAAAAAEQEAAPVRGVGDL